MAGKHFTNFSVGFYQETTMIIEILLTKTQQAMGRQMRKVIFRQDNGSLLETMLIKQTVIGICALWFRTKGG